MVDRPVMWRQATATGSSWNDTWNWRCTYSLGISGYGHFSFSLNSWAMLGWSLSGRPSSHTPIHQSASWPTPVTQHLSIEPTRDDSQWALNSMSEKCRPGKRSGTPPPISWQISVWGTTGCITAWVTMRLAAIFSVMGWLTCWAFSIMTRSVSASGSFTLMPPVWVWTNTLIPESWIAAHTGSKSRV